MLYIFLPMEPKALINLNNHERGVRGIRRVWIKLKRSIIWLLLVSLIVTLCSGPVLAAPSLTVQINGSVVDAPADMDIIEGQVMVPLRWAAEQLGASSVQWDPATPKVAIKTPQDFYSLEKLTSYNNALQSYIDEQDRQIWPLPDKAKNLHQSNDIPNNHDWILDFRQSKAQRLDSIQPINPFLIDITSNDGSYEHSMWGNSFENKDNHYFLPMDWLEYLFHARVNYNEATNILSIQTPDMSKIKSEITIIESTLVPSSADEAIKLWGRGEQTRNGALQYAALSPELRLEADKSNYVRSSHWVTGGSSPWVGPITIENQNKRNDTKIEYTLSFPEITSAPPNTIATEKLVVEKLHYNGQEGWFITQLLQSSDYGIIDGLYKSNSLYLPANRFSIPLPADWTIAYQNGEMIIKDGQEHAIGTIEQLGGYFLPNHSETLSDNTLTSEQGEGHLLLLSRSTPAASEIQASWQEVHAMIPLNLIPLIGQYWADICIKVNPGDDIGEIQRILQNAIIQYKSANNDTP